MSILKLNQGGKIHTGDTIYHIPSGETWLVAYSRNGEVCCCGWPESFAKVADCIVTKRATPEERKKLLEDMAKLGTSESRGRYAAAALDSGEYQ